MNKGMTSTQYLFVVCQGNICRLLHIMIDNVAEISCNGGRQTEKEYITISQLLKKLDSRSKQFGDR